MKTNKRHISLLGALTAGLILTGCGEPVVGLQGPQGEKGAEVFASADIYETWSLSLFQDAENGLPLFKNIWDEITSEQIAIFLAAQRQEMEAIAAAAVADCGQWMDNQYDTLFDNQQHY